MPRGFYERRFPAPNKMPQHTLDAILKAYREGYCTREVSAMLGVSQSLCVKVSNANGVARRDPRKGGTTSKRTAPDIVDAMVAAYVGGASAEEAGALHGMSPIVCLKALKERGITERKNRTPQELLDRMVANYLDGMTGEEAAKSVGVSGITCYKELKKREVRTRRPGTKEFSVHASARRQGIPIEEWERFSTSAAKLLEGTSDYKKWRRAIYKRDNFRCRKCEGKSGGVHAHHIFPKAKYPHLVLEEWNGITLCKVCHEQTYNREVVLARQYVALLGVTSAPLPLFDKWPDKPTTGRQRKTRQLSLF